MSFELFLVELQPVSSTVKAKATAIRDLNFFINKTPLVPFDKLRDHIIVILKYKTPVCTITKKYAIIENMAQIIPIASGKGGVGKSLLSANLAIALGQQGKRVVLVDLDLGASNLHLVIGQHPGAASLGSWFTEKTMFKDIMNLK